MSQIEHNIRRFISLHPEIERCVQNNLINRRSLARFMIKNDVARKNQIEAVIACLRRFQYRKYSKPNKNFLEKVRVRVKDSIVILDFEKSRSLMKELKNLIDSANYEKDETLKIVIGSISIKVFLDESRKDLITTLKKRFKTLNIYKNISEISMIFPEKAVDTKGVMADVSNELFINDILISEILTASPELLVYVKEEYAVKTYEIIKKMQKSKIT